MRKFGKTAVILMMVLGLATACNHNSNSANSHDQAASAQALSSADQSQPVPFFPWSQIRQNLIEIEAAQANTTLTTSFFMNFGADPILGCPSVGFPIHATDQITNPSQAVRQGVGKGNYVDGVVGQIDPTKIYTGQSTGTHVICVSTTGKPYDAYWEGYVMTITGEAGWDYTKHGVAQVTNPTGGFSVGKK